MDDAELTVTATQVLATAYGPMAVLPCDTCQYPALRDTRFSPDHNAIVWLTNKLIMQPRGAVIDVGASFGCWTLALAVHARCVIAFEPQLPVYRALCQTIALNQHKIIAHRQILSDVTDEQFEEPGYDYALPLQTGAVEWGRPQEEPIGQPCHPTGLYMPARRIDDYMWPTPISLIKIDAEGMDLRVLRGARHTIAEHRPLIYVETSKCHPVELGTELRATGYDFRDHDINLFAWPV